MNRITWWLVDVTAQRLDPEEREAALGDIVEARETPRQALGNVFGLVARRHLSLWKGWRPWIALVPAFFSCLGLMGLSVRVSLICQSALVPTEERTAGIVLGLLFIFAMLFVWSWTCGFVVGSISGRTVWESTVVSLIPCLFCLSRFRIESLSPLALFLFLGPAMWGLRRGVRATPIKLAASLGLAIGLALMAAPISGVKGPWVANRFLSWPAWYLIFVARKGAGMVDMRR